LTSIFVKKFNIFVILQKKKVRNGILTMFLAKLEENRPSSVF